MPPTHPFKVSFLGFYVDRATGLSNFTQGLVGKQHDLFNCVKLNRPTVAKSKFFNESSRVGTFAVGAELAVQSQQRRWDDGTRHPQLQPALSSAGTDEWVLSWRLNEESDSSGNRRAVGSRFHGFVLPI